MTTGLTNQDIYERVYQAISERKLLPGTKLSEEKLASAFHVSRTRIREVLFRLSQELIVELQPNRGAFIASPTHSDMRHVFQVRQALERGVVSGLCEQSPSQLMLPLRRHLQEEARARGDGDHLTLTRLTGEFHLRLAEATGNQLFTDNLRRLISLTGLIITQYGSRGRTACADHEHEDIVRAIEEGQSERACQLMQEHLKHVESDIHAPAESSTKVDFAHIFGLGPKKPVVRARKR